MLAPALYGAQSQPRRTPSKPLSARRFSRRPESLVARPGGPRSSDIGPGMCGPFYNPLSNRRSVMRGSMAAELSTLSEKPGATRIPRTLSAGTPLDSRFPM